MTGTIIRLAAGAAIGLGLTGFFASLPTTTNYSLQSYGFGSGGTANSSTSNYSLEGISGEVSDQSSSTANYYAKPGYIQAQQANVPKITLTNPSNYYDKLHFVIDQQSNPTDALYAIQVKVNDATCDFTTGTIRYVQSDDTLGSALVVADYQTYSAWGGSGGQNIIGLSSNLNYCVRAKATQGKFTESGYGPSSNAATVGQQISFCLYTSGSCAGGGNSVSLNLLAGTVAASSSNIGVDFATNADSGGNVFIYSAGSLTSSLRPGTSISSSSTDLGSASKGYGAQVISAAQTSGGPLAKQSPYNLSANNVGQLSTTATTILNSTSPLVGGSASVQLQAKSDNLTKAAPDYTDKITIVAAASF